MNPVKFFLIILLPVLVGLSSMAQKTKSEEITVRSHKKYYVHSVVHGQSLSAISKIYDIPVSDIKSANGLTDDYIREGEKLLVPVPDPGSQGNPSVQTEAKVSGSGREQIVYVPAEGETLYGLSQKFQVSIREILEANGGEDGPLKAGLKGGMSVKIPVSRETLAKIEQLTQDSVRGFFQYTVQKSETLYGIAWRYETTVDMILLFNPGITPMIEEGQLLKIPLKNASVNYTIHKVDKKITITRLAKSYNLEPFEIKAINPGLVEELKVGQQVKIPVKTVVETVKVEDRKKEEKTDKPDPVTTQETLPPVSVPVEVVSLLASDCKKINAGAQLNVALLIPFYLSKEDTSASRPEGETAGVLNSFSFIHFYEGCLIAIDSLEKAGISAKVFVFDITDDETEIKSLLRNPDMKKMDLIIGPFLGKSFTTVADFAKSNSIPIVNPFSFREEVTENNPMVFKAKPGQGSQFTQLTTFIDKTYPEATVFVMREGKSRDSESFQLLKVNIQSGLKNIPQDRIRFMDNGKDSLKYLPELFSETGINLLVIYTDNKAFALDCVRKLSEGRSKRDLRIIGLPRWDRFQFVEVDYLVDLKAHYFSPSFIDYSDEKTNHFIKIFRDRFQAEPEQYAFEGFDIMWYFMNGMSKFGNQFESCVSVYKPDLLQNQFGFKKVGTNGWENQYWNLLKYSDYKLIRATPYSRYFD